MTLRQLISGIAAIVGVAVAIVLVKPPGEDETAVDDRGEATTIIGRHLATRFAGERVLIISNPFTLEKGRDPSIYAYEEAGIDGLRRGIGQSLEVEAIVHPNLKEEYLRSPATFPIDPFSSTPLSSIMAANAFDELAAEHADCRIIVSLIGLPVSIATSEVWKKETPSFALLLPDLTMLGPVKNVVEAFESGKISCAMVRTPSSPEKEANTHLLVTRENIRETMATSPEVFGYRSLRK